MWLAHMVRYGIPMNMVRNPWKLCSHYKLYSPARSSFDKKKKERNLDIILERVDDQLLAEEGWDTGQHPGS